ncbi:MAG TPA: phospholipid carrier-dependent glycosyltransferase [Acidobacteriaceae bacterium]|jgi:4-amino-4-deoxy-L-arabinose transferase-like glycosyltransferase|nr:phospholipid carrier-dependent glycosyltransferase [Acidobacteriaceae bacterium]
MAEAKVEKASGPARTRATLLWIVGLWAVFYASFALLWPPLLDDADSVHAEVAREMLLRHDPVTLYANGIRYLEKAPLLYWSMAACLKVAGLLGITSARCLAAAVRVPLALAVFALALVCENLARRLFQSQRAGFYAALILLSSFGIFIFTRITIPDAMVCLWVATAIACFWRTEQLEAPAPPSRRTALDPGTDLRWCCWGFATSCALNVLTKGLIGVVFPVGTVVIYLLLTRGLRRTWTRLQALCPWSSLLLFLAIGAPWHVLAGLANPTQGHPQSFQFVDGHWIVPLPTDRNVRGWFWFYFMNEHVLRYLNLRVPRDYDTVPLAIFWGLCLVWLMPWSAFVFKAAAWAVPLRSSKWRSQFRRRNLPLKRRGLLLLAVWAGFVLLFFSLSTRQEYYVLPAFPALAVLLAGWLARGRVVCVAGRVTPAERCLWTLTVLGGIFALASAVVLLHTAAPSPGTDLASLLRQNPGEYAMSMGHFLDLNAAAMGMFRLPLVLAALGLFGGPLGALLLRRCGQAHRSNLALAAGAFMFLLAAHLGLQTFAPVISSAPLAEAIRAQVRPGDIIAIHGEYESGSTLAFYLHRADLHILEGRSSNLWYGSFFPDAPRIFETPESFAAKWAGPQRIFLWQSLTDPPSQLPPLHGPVYVVARGGGKEIVSNQPGP